MYGYETWTVTTKTRKNLEAAEMWSYRRIIRIPWTAHQTNVSVLQRMRQERKLLCCIEQRQLKFLGHVIRKGEFADLALSGRIPGKRARGAQRFTFIHNFKGLCKNPGKLWETARNRTQWKNISTSRARSAMIPKERDRVARRPVFYRPDRYLLLIY